MNKNLNASLNELDYEGGVGIHELMAFYDKATPEQCEQMELYMKDQNVPAVKELVHQVTGMTMHNIKESWKSNLAKAALATSLVLSPKTASAQNVSTQPKIVSTVQEKYGYTVEDIIAATLVDEAGGEKNAVQGMHAVLNVIMNRSKGDLRNAAIACLKPKQFAGWNDIDKTSIPEIREYINGKKKHRRYTIALSLVNKAKDGTLEDITKGSNHFLNVSAVSSMPSWYNEKKVKVNYGGHTFLKLEQIYANA